MAGMLTGIFISGVSLHFMLLPVNSSVALHILLSVSILWKVNSSAGIVIYCRRESLLKLTAISNNSFSVPRRYVYTLPASYCDEWGLAY